MGRSAVGAWVAVLWPKGASGTASVCSQCVIHSGCSVAADVCVDGSEGSSGFLACNVVKKDYTIDSATGEVMLDDSGAGAVVVVEVAHFQKSEVAH